MKNDGTFTLNGVRYLVQEEYVMVHCFEQAWKCPIEKYGLWTLLYNLRVIYSGYRPYKLVKQVVQT